MTAAATIGGWSCPSWIDNKPALSTHTARTGASGPESGVRAPGYWLLMRQAFATTEAIVRPIDRRSAPKKPAGHQRQPAGVGIVNVRSSGSGRHGQRHEGGTHLIKRRTNSFAEPNAMDLGMRRLNPTLG
ncbi:hypothetical protein XA68_12099 [Ophiocordyceps unilateralis]|uniref:Uncharacterized protein n=1 Tax=Ophiocordyceps unilateralis TaxID=268505 RepID=A0A2A9PFC3_OPHUN|nr:hypothetical protein XA68_12099 [Ophiocordyceps unilateralis]